VTRLASVVRSIAEVLHECPALETLDLTFNAVRDAGAVALAAALSNGSNLKTLKLYR
jgi:Ran GTPase-activating protein (RanGAP) involved in mRNA processing and transport